MRNPPDQNKQKKTEKLIEEVVVRIVIGLMAAVLGFFVGLRFLRIGRSGLWICTLAAFLIGFVLGDKIDFDRILGTGI